MPPPTSLPCCRHTVVKDDEQLVIETASGQRITLQQSSASVLIEDANGNTIRLNPAGITITAAAKVVVSTSQVEINASMVTVNAPMARFTGTVQADTLIANSVIASSYTPGAGKHLVKMVTSAVEVQRIEDFAHPRGMRKVPRGKVKIATLNL